MSKQTIAIGGGKGGVGKSLIAANLAIAMAQANRRVVLIDADLGGANLHTLFGIDRPKILLEHFIAKRVGNLAETLLPTPDPRLSIICGGMPVLGTANPVHSQKMKLIRHILALEADVIVLDIGAGIGFNVLDLFNAAEIKIAVFTPQLTSLHNGYGFLKAAIHRHLQRSLTPSVRDCFASTGPESGAESLSDVLNRLDHLDKDEAHKARSILLSEKLYLLGNMVRTSKEGQVIGAVGKMIKDHLQMDAPLLGNVRYGEKIQKSVNERRPFMLWAGIESNALTFRNMATTLLTTPTRSLIPKVPGEADQAATDAGPEQYNRKHPRFPVRRIRGMLKINNLSIPGHVRNVAYGGVLVAFDKAVPNPGDGKLTIGPTADGTVVDVLVRERHRDASGRQIGFSFREIGAVTRTAIASLVASAAASTAVRRTPTAGLSQTPYSAE
ncbi:MAG: P-loop NTPase [Myxococcota bacterium]|nr:P-loop NTPase [Myxococcota bacterium]